ncbi:hypothetical protein GCM10010182_02340 [Actinomadura cremea]|nr:hypothetical protein GCM10010182_02340 [Actinomadura cremea]
MFYSLRESTHDSGGPRHARTAPGDGGGRRVPEVRAMARTSGDTVRIAIDAVPGEDALREDAR